jgi:hypothetical protein
LLAFFTAFTFLAVAQLGQPVAHGGFQLHQAQSMFGQLFAEQQIALAFGLARRRRDFLDDQISQRAD